MKKQLVLILIAVFATIKFSSAQSVTYQAARWYMAPKFADMTINTPSASAIPNFAPGNLTQSPPNPPNPPDHYYVVNGMYDDANNLLFYVADNRVYDYNNSLLGTIPNAGTEVVICPFGNNGCQRKFNIFTTSGGQAATGNTGAVVLCRTVVDMNSYSLSTSVIDMMTPYQNDPYQEFGVLALSKDTNPNKDRYLYFLCGSGTLGGPSGQINQILVHQDGSVTAVGKIYPTIAEPNHNAGAEVFAQEMDLSPDGLWLAWASFAPEIYFNPPSPPVIEYKYHLIQLDNLNPNNYGGYLPMSYIQFNNDFNNGNKTIPDFRGVEFWDNKVAGQNHLLKLFLGAGDDGILSIPIPWPSYPSLPKMNDFTKVTNSNIYGFGFSQIELANNTYMYASTAPGNNNVGAFDPLSGNPVMIQNSSFTLTNPAPQQSNWGTVLYTLPDQIDDQDYSVIVPAAFNPQLTWGTYEFGATGTSTATWTDGPNNNPWNATISNPVIITQQLKISHNSHLTIDGMKFRFSPQAKVTIEQGSSLILNNATLTGNTNVDEACPNGYTWQGIEVWGTANQPQSNATAQGKLILQNNSVIEHAQWGARTWHPIYNNQVPDFSESGGIVIATSGASFINDSVGVEIPQYHNMPYPKKLLPNQCYFENTNFITNNNYLFGKPPVHALLSNCEGVQFINCSFTNAQTNLASPYLAGIGIEADDAGFRVSTKGFAMSSFFNNLYRGIFSRKLSNNKTFIVDHSEFNDNAIGILLRGGNNFTITNNQFRNCNPSALAASQIGILLRSCSGYTIEENTFSTTNACTQTYGIKIFNSGAADNQIYKNYFDNIQIANSAYGINRDNSSFGSPAFHGLQYLCNHNTGSSTYDFDIEDNSSSLNGIRLNQGSASMPAANTFNGSSGYEDFFNNTNQSSNYFYNTNAPVFFNSPLVTLITSTASNTCPTHINNGTQQQKLSPLARICNP